MDYTEKLKQRLLQERRQLEEQIKRIQDWGLGEQESWSLGELSSYDQHPADQGSETFERGKEIALRDRALIRLRQVDSALAKLEIGTYGVCERCGRQIDAERLEAVPFANLCFECKRQEEAEHQDDEARPVEESVVPPWYSFRDNRHEHIAFDGEDTWQALAKYGTTNSPQDVLDSVDFADAYIDADEDIGFVDEMDSLVDIRGDGVSDLEAVYPEPLNRPARKRVR